MGFLGRPCVCPGGSWGKAGAWTRASKVKKKGTGGLWQWQMQRRAAAQARPFLHHRRRPPQRR
eukprot:4084329-Lingulodinium_polyedra.AAC.1